MKMRKLTASFSQVLAQIVSEIRKQCNEKAQLPANKRSHQIITDLTDSDIPPLLSRASMS